MGVRLDNVSRRDSERMNASRNRPEYKPGFEPEDERFTFEDEDSDEILFDTLDDVTEAESNGGGFGSLMTNSDNSGINMYDKFRFNDGDSKQNVSNDKGDEISDKIFEAAIEYGKLLIKLFVAIFRSIATRTNTELSSYCVSNIKVGGVIFATAVVMIIISLAMGSSYIMILGLSVLSMGTIDVIASFIMMGICIAIAYKNSDKNTGIHKIPDLKETNETESVEEFEKNSEEMFDQFMSEFSFDEDTYNDDEDDGEDDDGEDDDGDNGAGDLWARFDAKVNGANNKKSDEDEIDMIDFNKMVDNIESNTVINRVRLVNIFKSMLPKANPSFSSRREITENDDEFEQIENNLVKVVSNLTRVDVEDVKERLYKVSENMFSYEIKFERAKGLNKLEDLEREVEAYFRENSEDRSVNASVSIEGDYYKIILTKGCNDLVTIGDILDLSEVEKFFTDLKNRMPVILGVDSTGKPILADAGKFDSILIAGKPRSGKSWYIMSLIMQMVLFNNPEDIQIILVDPKGSNLFRTIGIMPHVAGTHDADNIIEIMRDLIDIEAERRKKLLVDNHCDDIWELRDNGIKIPVVILVIDEVITIKAKLSLLGKEKEFDSLMMTIMSQLPSLGIRLAFVPHRAKTVIVKTNRTMITFSAAVGASVGEVKETLEISKWSRELTEKGDIAIRADGITGGLYVRGPGVCTDNKQNRDFITAAAEAFYKMGVEIPTGEYLGCGSNRDEEEIKKRLTAGKSGRVQYSLDNIDNIED